MEIVKLIGIGIILGIANVIPGVSGGTMAVVFGVYERLIAVITPNIKKILAQWTFWLPLFAGTGIGIILFSRVITFLFEHYPLQTNWFFIGIIAGSIPMICNRIRTEAKSQSPAPKISIIICAIITFVIMLITLFLRPDEGGHTIYTMISAKLFLMLFCGAALAAIAMIIPGISGSFLMLVIGIYSTVIAAVSSLNIPLLIPVALGVLAGLLGGAGLIRILMARVPAQTYGAILGLVAGSIPVIYPGFGSVTTAIVSIICAAIGFLVSYFSSRSEKN